MSDDSALNYPRPHRVPDGRGHHVPPAAQTLGMWIFLLGLALLFASGMLVYVIARFQMREDAAIGLFRGDLMSWKLVASTALVLAASFTIHKALGHVRRERVGRFRAWLWATNVLAVAFVAVQTPAMIEMLSNDPVFDAPAPVASPFAGPGVDGAATDPRELLPGTRGTRLWSIVFFFVLIHALHVIGGIIFLAVVTWKARQGLYDHEHYVGVRHAALYWHFLDAVWLMMLATFLVLG